MKKLSLILAAALSWSACNISSADDYNHIALDLFWKQLYEGGGWTLYCGYRFDGEGNSPEGYAIGIDHIYATEWMLDYLGCDNRMQCYNGNNEKFVQMESDLHNLYPAWSDLMVYRAGRRFGSLDALESRFDDCDYKWKAGLIEPRTLSKGNVARAIFYMHARYDAPVPGDMIETLKKWNREDPPSEQEKIRNDRIEKIQGRRNPFIDDPGLIDRIGVLTDN